MAYVGGAQVIGVIRDRGWEDVGTQEALDRNGVIYLASERVFVIANDDHPVALSAISPHLGEQLLYCRSSGWFQDVNGDHFDRFGVYATGPAPRGMDQVELRVTGDLIQVKPTAATDGLPRNASRPRQPAGRFCPDRPGAEPGFAASP